MNTDRLDMTIAADWDVKPQTKQEKLPFYTTVRWNPGALYQDYQERADNMF